MTNIRVADDLFIEWNKKATKEIVDKVNEQLREERKKEEL